MSQRRAPVIVVMGVSGCGKSTVARALSDALDLSFIEADTHHSEANRRHMAAGLPLSDAMREPFVASLCAAIEAEARGCVVAFSALRRAHRDRIRALGGPTQFLHLRADSALIGARIEARHDHFMPASLLGSQFAALEAPADESDTITLDAERPADYVIIEAVAAAARFLQRISAEPSESHSAASDITPC